MHVKKILGLLSIVLFAVQLCASEQSAQENQKASRRRHQEVTAIQNNQNEAKFNETKSSEEIAAEEADAEELRELRFRMNNNLRCPRQFALNIDPNIFLKHFGPEAFERYFGVKLKIIR